MQFDAEAPQPNAITAYSDAGIVVGGQTHTTCLLIDSGGLLLPWQVQDPAGGLSIDDLAAIVHLAWQKEPEHAYELLLLGTGRTAFFPPAPWIAPFVARGLPLEVMGTLAACRTYNVVASEGRKVLAALWQPF